MKKHPHKRTPRSAGTGSKPRFSRRVELLYEDDAVVVLNKPAGMLAVPIRGSMVPSALSLLSEALKAKRQRAFVVHRIDRFTSGIVLFAKTQSDRERLVKQFLNHTPIREYLAVVRGHLRESMGTLRHYLRRDGMFQKISKENDRNASPAELSYSVERELRDASMVRVKLITGLQNQIRVQFSAIGHPVIGDRKYHPKEADEALIARVALHATALDFVHPRSNKTIRINCPPPADFQELVRALQNVSSKNP